MDDYKDAITACCKQLRLSVNLVENAIIQTGESHQEYLYNLLRDEIQYRKSTRVAKLIVVLQIRCTSSMQIRCT